MKFSKLLGFIKDQSIFSISNNNKEADKAKHIFPYGIKSVATEGDVFVAENNCNSSDKVILGGVFKTQDINENEVLLYSQNNSILLKANGDIEVLSNTLKIKASGNIIAESPKIIAKGQLFVGDENASFTPLCLEDISNITYIPYPGGSPAAPIPVVFNGQPQAKNMKLS